MTTTITRIACVLAAVRPAHGARAATLAAVPTSESEAAPTPGVTELDARMTAAAMLERSSNRREDEGKLVIVRPVAEASTGRVAFLG